MSSTSDDEHVSGAEDAETATNPSNVTGDYLKKSDVLAALQVDGFENLPPVVKKRVNALKNLQLQVTNLEAKFYEEVHLLECKYNRLYYPIHEKRHNIITGLYEPTAEECEWKLESELTEAIAKELKEKAKVDDGSEKPDDVPPASEEVIVGIPLFWLTALKNVPMIAEMIQPCDEPILTHLIDIKSIVLEADPMGFVLEFHFRSNEFFSNSVLTKEYEMKCIPDPCDPFGFEGPEIVKCKGCKIDWKKGKNVTVKQVKKKQKHKGRNTAARTVIKTIQNDSFFNFFNPPEVPDDSDSEDYEETQELLTTDFEIGHYIRERVVPNAVLFFTGEAGDDDFEEEEAEEEEDDEEVEEDDSDLEEIKEESPSPTKKVGEKRKSRNSVSSQVPKPNQTNADCKQQ